MTIVKTLLLSIFLFNSAFASGAALKFQISGDVTELTKEGEAVLATSSDVMGEKIEVTRAKINNGVFSLSGEFGEIERATVEIVNKNGRGQGSVSIVLEDAPVQVSYHGKYARLRAEGDGKYQKMLISSWQQSKEYKTALENFKQTATKRDGLKDGRKKKALTKEYWKLYYVMPEIRQKALDAVATSKDDPLASSLAIQLGGLNNSDDAVSRLNELEEILGPQQGLVNRRKAIQGAILRRLNSKLAKKNAQDLEVSAKDIEGKLFKLNAELKKNEYVLLEFWASWCGPCIDEVPHLKKAYEEFNDKGFEIFSFSVDDERKLWVEASKQINPPWISVSDLKALDSPTAVKYGVQIVPRNFLLNKTGEVIARDLRGEALPAKLRELINN